MLVTGLLAWVAYAGVRNALAGEFARRLEALARTAASQVSAADIRDTQLLGEDGTAYLSLQVLLEELRSSTGLMSAAALDSAGITLYDTRGAEHQHEPNPLARLAPAAITAALAGRAVVTDVYEVGGQEFRSGLAPIAEGGKGKRVLGALVVDSRLDYLPVLAALRRTVLLAALLSAFGIVVLAVVNIRVVGSADQLERRLSRAEKLAAMGRLTATLAHEIKNPLAIIRGSAERLGKLDPESRRWADSVVEESDRLTRTVGRYLQFARGEETPSGEGDAAQALIETLDLLEGEFRSRRAHLVRPDPAPDALPVALDNESLKQVFLNLMLNALEALGEGGRLVVSVEPEPARIAVRFADDGPGIPPETLRQLGSPFITTKATGSGLGLFLSRRLVQAAGGTLEVTSDTEHGGRGTVCTVRLPRR